MATTLGPDTMVEAATDSMGFSGPHYLAVPGADDGLLGVGPALPSPQLSPRSTVPLPNPPFVFPARASLSPASAPSSYSRATGRRPRSAIDFFDRSLGSPMTNESRTRSPALPDFMFNPGASIPSSSPTESTLLSPPQSPSTFTTNRPIGHGHRRGGSEFVGGKIRNGDTITVMSTSPTKSESGMASPTLAPARPRGHAHRRSAAISSHDLSSIITPSGSNLRGNSAPTSPATYERQPDFSFPAFVERPSQSEPSLTPKAEISTEIEAGLRDTAHVQLQQPPKHAARNRVGFSDTLEFIPRPLSLVSSDTSSTMTARPGHSLSGSISSIVSASNLDRETNPPVVPNQVRQPLGRRPSTAGAVLERTQSVREQESASLSPRRRGSIPYMGAMHPSANEDEAPPSPVKTPKRWSFFGLEPFVPAGSPTRSRPRSSSSAESQTKQGSSTRSSSDYMTEPAKEPEINEVAVKPSGQKKNKKQRKVKMWAGSILSRNSKQRHGKQKRRAPTPPPLKNVEVDEEDYEEGSPDMAFEPEPVMPTLMVTETGESAPRPVPDPDEDLSYPMIDLDAALGPFNTPLPRNPEWEAAQRAGGLVKKQLHSAAGMTRFTGPGMHYSHRRAESAPEMAPFEAVRYGIHRYGSSSTMADVFEEEEDEDEDDEDEEGCTSKEASTGDSTPVAELTAAEEMIEKEPLSNAEGVVESSEIQDGRRDSDLSHHGGVKRKGSDLGEEEKAQASVRVKSEHSTSSLHEEVIDEEPSDMRVPMVRGDETSSVASVSPRHIFKGKELAPVDVGPLNLLTPSLAPVSPYSMTQSSSFPSPRSPMSYDAHRISTAPSSITEDNFQSLLMGEPGPEVRLSFDVPPSLTSSTSTMTRESAIATNPQARYPPLGDQPRPASFTSTAFGRRRSSLASLSRLINSSHGERSKLSMEVPMDAEPEKKNKSSKTKRISRMMQFWKTKDN